MSDSDIYTAQRFGQRMGFGASPALLIIDFMQAYTDEAQFGGFNINDAIEATSRLPLAEVMAEVARRQRARAAG
jgi:hypothetical protein